jgi:hypothetical protein
MAKIVWYISWSSVHEGDKTAGVTQSKERASSRYMTTTTLLYLLKAVAFKIGYAVMAAKSPSKGLCGHEAFSLILVLCALQDKVYSHEGFIEHFRECSEV